MMDISGSFEGKAKPEARSGILIAIVFQSMNACNFETLSR